MLPGRYDDQCGEQRKRARSLLAPVSFREAVSTPWAYLCAAYPTFERVIGPNNIVLPAGTSSVGFPLRIIFPPQGSQRPSHSICDITRETRIALHGGAEFRGVWPGHEMRVNHRVPRAIRRVLKSRTARSVRQPQSGGGSEPRSRWRMLRRSSSA